MSPRYVKPERPGWVLRRLDQAAVAGLIVAAALAMGVYWYMQRGPAGLVEIDRAAPQSATFWVDINHADWPELSQLPGVGETLARRIVEQRETAGPFADHNDLRKVRGIGPKTLERMRPYLRPMPAGADVARD